MTQPEKDDLKHFFERLSIKTTEIIALIKDGKVVVGHDKLEGVLKVIQQFHAKIVKTEISE